MHINTAIRRWPKALVLLMYCCLTRLESIRLMPGGGSIQYPFWKSKKRQLLSSFQATIPTHPDDHLVANIPNITLSTRHWAGHLPVSADGTRFFFYWLFAPQETEEADVPLIVWLNGGPGCSSMNGVFIENGPFRINEDGNIALSQHSWHRLPAYTLYVDQPVGTGLSFKTNQNSFATSDEQFQNDFYAFLQSFFQLHADKFVTNHTVHRPFYFSGESYAGRYIPLFVSHIIKQNKIQQLQIPVHGAAIGNGWIDPYHQYSGARAAYGMGLVGLSEVHAEMANERQCQQSLPKVSAVCDYMISDIVHQSMGDDSEYKVSQYDIRRVENKTGPRMFPPGKAMMEAYLRNESVLKALHALEAARAAVVPFSECQGMPLKKLEHLDGHGVMPEIRFLLEHDVRLFFYNGVLDLVCHHVGTEVALDNMPWEHRDAWKLADRYVFLVDNNELAGFLKQFRNLFYFKVLHAGHMVPLDVPNVAFAMMKTLVYGLEFRISTQRQDLEQSTARSCVCCGWMGRHHFELIGVSVVLLMLIVAVSCCWVFSRIQRERAEVKYDGVERMEEHD